MSPILGIVNAVTADHWLPVDLLDTWRHTAWHIHADPRATDTQRALARRWLLQHAVVGGREARQ